MDEDELTPEQRFAAEDAETMVPRELSRGRSREELMAELVRLDWDPVAAEQLIDRAAEDLARFRSSPESREKLRHDARRQMLAGCAMVLLGIGLLVSMVVLAMGGLLPVIVLSGSMLIGFVVFNRGWSRWRLYRRDTLPFEDSDPSDHRR